MENGFEGYAFTVLDVDAAGKTAEPVGVLLFDEKEGFDDKVAHVAENEVVWLEVVEEIEGDGFILRGGKVELVEEGLTSEEIEADVDFAACGGAKMVAVAGEFIGVVGVEGELAGVFDEDASEGTRSGGGDGVAVLLGVDQGEAANKEALGSDGGAVEAFVKGLGAGRDSVR